ncbi:YSC84-related protein [Robiginitalea marina]|uniref:Lipid-binding SYLF domain-containing protein n=1 Tax=Robiginitalea marina TaxID=2954105 RepID=A0ABT1AV31_9FLAO|nr:lipid-binding SYLF domain-containing protein [Robiginitalea marina]MCO5723918.1 lipid-binding SYLF domain-containing protein [Robiginitalea marina]
MKKIRILGLFFLLGSLAMPLSAQSKKDQKIMKDADRAVKTLLNVNSELREYFDNSAGAAVFPNVGKGGFIIGGASGNGVLYHAGKKVGMASLKAVSIGFQAGGEALIEVIFFETDQDVEKFKEGNYEFDAGVSATMVETGVSVDAEYRDGVAVFTYAKKGLMAEVSVGGQKFNFTPF